MKRHFLVPAAFVVVLLPGCGAVGDVADKADPAAESVARDAADEAVDAVVPDNGSAIGPAGFAAAAVLEDTTLVDVRTAEEFAAGHLPGAVNIDLQADDFAREVAELDPEATYAVYCRTDNRSGQAVEVMLEQGFTGVYHLDGGIETWIEAGRDVVTGR